MGQEIYSLGGCMIVYVMAFSANFLLLPALGL